MVKKSLKELKIDSSLEEKLEELVKHFIPRISDVELTGFKSKSIRLIEDEIVLSRCELIGGG